MKKGFLAFVLAFVMVLTSLPITAKAATPQLVYRYAGYDNTTNKHCEIPTNAAETTISANAGNGSPVTLYFVDANGTETPLYATDITTSDADIVSFEADMDVPQVIHLRYNGVGAATLNYVKDNTTYSITVNTQLPMVGFYTSQAAAAAGYVNQYTVTDSSNVLYIISTVGDIASVDLNENFDKIATVSKVSSTVYQVTVSGTPSQGYWYQAEVAVTDPNNATGETCDYYASVDLINGKSALMYSYMNTDNNGQPVPAPELESSIRLAKGYVNDIYVYFMEQGTTKNGVAAGNLGSSNTDVVTISVSERDQNAVSLSPVGFGTATISYTHTDGKVYSFDVTVGLPDIGFYSTTTVSQSTYLNEFVLTDAGSNVVYLVANNGTLSNVRLNNGLQDIASAALSSDGTYATITITGTPDDRWYDVQAEFNSNNGYTNHNGVSIRIKDERSALRYKGANWNNGVPSESDHFMNDLYLDMGYNGNVYVFFTSGGVQNAVLAGKLTSSDPNVITVAAHEDYSNMVVLTPADFGTASISYTHTDGKVYSFDVTVGLPGIGFYTSSAANQSTYITEYTLTDTGSNKIYLVNREGSIGNVSLNGDFDEIADATLSSDGKYVEITIHGTPGDRFYGMEIEVISNDGGRWNENFSVKLINHKTSLQYSFVNWDNNDMPYPAEWLNGQAYVAKGYTQDIYPYFMLAGNKTLVNAGSLSSSDENIVKIYAHPEHAGVVILEGVDFGNAQIVYEHTDGKIYTFDVEVGLPEYGYYSAPVATQGNYLTSFTVTDTGANKIYLVGLSGEIQQAQLNGGLDQIANAQISTDKKYVEITITGTPENRWYDTGVWVIDDMGNGNMHGASIELINHKSALMLRYPDFSGNGPAENTDFSLVADFYLNKGQNEPAYFYFVSQGQETKLALSDLKSSDEQIFTVAVYEGSDAIVLESVNCGTAQLQYTVGGVTYNLPVTVRLPEIGCYTSQIVDESDFVKEYTVTETANQLYILPRDGQKIMAVNLLGDLNNIAKADIAPDNSYAILTVDGNPDGQNYDYKVILQESDGRQEAFGNNITLYNGKPYIGLCWPDENTASGHGELNRFLDTAVGYGTDVWVYLAEGSTETMLGYADLKSSDESIIKITDPGYNNGMVKLETVGWGTATVSYTSNGKTYSIDIVSDIQAFGYYSEKAMTRDNWIRSFTVTDDKDTFYFMAANGITFDQLMPTQDLQDIAAINLSADKTWVEIKVTGEPQEIGDYGLEFKFSHVGGEQGEGRDILDFIKDLRTKVEVENLPVVDPNQTVTQVTVGVDQTVSAEALEDTAKDIVDAVENGKNPAELPIPAAVADSIKEALENEDELKITTTVYIDSLKKEEIQDQEVVKDIEAIEKYVSVYNGLVAQYLDLGVIMTTYVNGAMAASGEVEELASPVKFVVALPESIKEALEDAPAGYERQVYVICVHNGIVKEIPATRNADGTVTFEASEFSTYALAYKDTKTTDAGQPGGGMPGDSQPGESQPDSSDQDGGQQSGGQSSDVQQDSTVQNPETPVNVAPNTADTHNAPVLMLGMLIAFMGIVLLMGKRKTV